MTVPDPNIRLRLLRWLALLALSAAGVGILELFRLPAALLLGPMFAAILMATSGKAVKVPDRVMFAAQGVIGCMMANAIPLTLLAEIARAWPIFLAGVVSVIAVSVTFGWLLARFEVLPGSTAIWGSVPGAASAMTILSDSYGADMRLVAMMQYMRVLCVALAASMVSRFFLAHSGAEPPAIVWFGPIAWLPFAETILLIVVAALVTRFVRIPAGMMILPLIFGALFQDVGLMRIELPPWLLAMSYAVVGWSIGQRFTREILAYAARALPRVIASILSLIAICGLFAWLLVLATGIDPLTAYLATSPGGADSVAIISASANVDVPFVMAMQLARFLVILVIGPTLASLVVKWAGFPARPTHVDDGENRRGDRDD
jgi:membrane AbrB-like protein